MNQAQLNAAITKLAPEFAKEAADAVLLRYARANNLAPAELERLAQYTNVCMAVSHTKKAHPDDRGQEILIVDPAAIVAAYTDTTKKASAPTVSAPMSWTATDTPAFSVGNHFRPDLQTSKAAHQVVEPESIKQAHDPDVAFQGLIRTHDMLQRLDQENKLAMRDLHAKLASHIHSARHLVPKLLADVRLHSKAAADVGLLKYIIGDLGYYVPDDHIKQAADVTFSSDTLKVSSIVRELDECYAQADALRAIERDIMQEVERDCPKYASVFSALDAQKYPAPPSDQDAGAEATEVSSDAASEPSEQELMDGYRGDLQRELGDINQMREIYRTLGLPEQGLSAPRKGEREAPAPAAKDAPAPERGVLTGLGAAATGAGQLAHTAGSGMEATRRSLEALLGLDVSGHARQTAAGMASLVDPNPDGRANRMQNQVQRYQQAIVLSRLLNTDEILQKADPKQVTAIYRSIAHLNPHIAADINAVRPLLREASQYQGVPLQSMKTLQEIQPGARQPVRRP